MGRKQNPGAEPVDVQTNPEALAAASGALTELGRRSAEIAERFADGLPYDRERVVAEARFLMAQSAEAMLEAGKRLIQLKENEPHGDFLAIVETQLGLGRRSAQAMMQAAVKYLSPALRSKAQALAPLGRAKLFDLMVESDEDLADLAEGGTLAGKSLDDLQSMTHREVKAALIDARQQLTAKDKVIAKRDQKISKLEEQAERDMGAESEALRELQERVLAAQASLMQLGALVQELANKELTEEFRSLVNTDVEYLAQIFEQIVAQGGIPVQFQEMVNPSWLKSRKAPRA